VPSERAGECGGQLPPNESDVPKCEIRDVPDEAYFDGRIAKLAVAALGELKEKRQPFFLSVGFWKPHAYFNAPKKYWDLYDRSDIEPPRNPAPPKDVPKIALHNGREIRNSFKSRPGGRPTAAETLALRHGYYGATSYADAQVGVAGRSALVETINALSEQLSKTHPRSGTTRVQREK